MFKRCVAPALAGLVLLLAACMVPEKFTAEYEIKPNGDYSFKYEGTMVNALSRMAKREAAEKGAPVPDAQQMEEVVGIFKIDPRVTEFKEAGNDVYTVKMEEKGNIKVQGDSYFLEQKLDYWTLAYNAQDNTVTLAVSPLKGEDLKEVDISVDGEFKIHTDCEIVSSSVELDKSLLGFLFGNTYSFKINNESFAGVTVVMKLE